MRTPDFVINQIKKKNFSRSSIPGAMNTVCFSAKCPNRGECFEKGQMTFLILGDVCTRNCKFCAVTNGKPTMINSEEIENVLESIKKFNLEYVVITSVTRDDLSDGGAQHFANLLMAIRDYNPQIKVEVLTPDFKGDFSSLEIVLQAKPFVFNHNLEMVPRIFSDIRPEGDYEVSLKILDYAKKTFSQIKVKTGIMVGLGETKEEVFEVIDQVKQLNLNCLTIGQYLAPSKAHQKIDRYVSLEEFKEYEDYGRGRNLMVVAGPLIRSSYNAENIGY